MTILRGILVLLLTLAPRYCAASTPAMLPIGSACVENGECSSNMCAMKGNGPDQWCVQCSTNLDCIGSSAGERCIVDPFFNRASVCGPKAVIGETCDFDDDCLSGNCSSISSPWVCAAGNATEQTTPESSASPTEPISPVVAEVNAVGALHFKTWKNEIFDHHGQCDIVMVSNKDFANGLGIQIHIRTKIVRFWSYIQRAIIKIGNDTFEVEGSSASYWMNSEHNGKLSDLGGFPVSKNPEGDRYTIDLESLYPGESIQIHTYKEFVGVKIIGASESSFGNSSGITGDFRTGNAYGRDGTTVIHDFEELANEWQVVPSDGLFFHDNSRPQFPERCWVADDPRGQRRRRLNEYSVTENLAEAVCDELEDEFSRKGCVYDILATQDLDMVGAY